MHSFSELRAIVEEELQNLSLPEDPPELYEPVRYMINIGGKRIRPVLTLMGGELYEVPPEKAMHLGVAMELFHNFTLMHDDIMDGADVRRGQPTVHHKWDVNRAILSGDITFTLAYQQVLKSQEDFRDEALKCFNETAFKVCEGQQWDMNFETSSHVGRDDYLKMIAHKTAWLIGSCLKMGAIAAEAREEEAARLFECGQAMGMAFQLQDDILDTFGDEQKLGKNIGGDILANKKTILLVNAFEKASPEKSRELAGWMENGSGHEKVAAVKDILRALEVKEDAEKTMNLYYQQGLDALFNLDVPEFRKKPLKSLFENLMGRES